MSEYHVNGLPVEARRGCPIMVGGGCELFNMGTRNWTLFYCKNLMLSYLLNQLSRTPYICVYCHYSLLAFEVRYLYVVVGNLELALLIHQAGLEITGSCFPSYDVKDMYQPTSNTSLIGLPSQLLMLGFFLWKQKSDINSTLPSLSVYARTHAVEGALLYTY